MIGGDEILDHLLAMAIIWGAAIAAGLLPALMLPTPFDRRDCLIASPILGCAWWTAAFYLFAFPGGLMIAAAVTGLLAIAAAAIMLIRKRRRTAKSRVSPLACLVLLAGCCAYITPLFVQHAPLGRESWKAALSARQIGPAAGMQTGPAEKPGISGQFLQGAPVMAGLAVWAGCSPLGAMLAEGQFVMSLLILAIYLMVRLSAKRLASAVIAVAVCWILGGTQSMAVTGELPMLTTISLGLLGCRMILDYGRHSRLISIIPVGIAIGAMPMINVFGAGSWALFAAGPAALFAILFSRSRLQTLSAGLLAWVAAALVAGAAFLAAKSELESGNYQWLRPGDVEFASVQGGLFSRLGPGLYVMEYLDFCLVLPAMACLIMLFAARRWAALTIILLPASMVAAAVIASIWLLSPAAQLLGPRHDLYWLGPAAGLLFGITWRWGWPRLKGRRISWILAGVFLVAGMARHVEHFQDRAVTAMVDENVWQGLKWAAGRLDPEKDMVLYMFDTPGSLLPAMCGAKAADHSEKSGPYAEELFTYVFMVNSPDIDHDNIRYQVSEISADKLLKPNLSRIVFGNDRVTIYQVEPGRR
ncbi:MAG: hypothetical protein HZA50_10570 [Planctomycetes bacterium]|nr:hypothetical protein [Planctomycetota bacterium]